MEIKKLNKNEFLDFRNLIEIFKEVFENNGPIPDNDHLGKLLSNPDFMAFIVRLNGKVIGGLTIYVLHGYYSTRPVAYIYDVAIAPHFQGQGLGKALMAEVCRFCTQNGFEEAYVEAESEDIDAVGFYRSTRYGHETNAIHFTYTFWR